ncbi:hypothetical protein PRK78_006606 [Emydomyces testavorans]|uniref:Aminoglycoside phosphotransferase domain-containing protein n=1 Tax=Emydomyces testavorans TaxID=2070801 RepID=A0AAF0DNS7_9EURO|nr:hypothetical protein PRK78_006606 [Emydomyces testavorans]
MAKTYPSMRGEITYSQAKGKESNALLTLEDYEQTLKFFTYLKENIDLIQDIASHHLGVSPESCEVCKDVRKWHWGSFNVAIPIAVPSFKRVLIRFPIPHRAGERFQVGNVDEKIQCEAGAYVWLQENCPSIRIPKLYGFAFSGQSFTAIEYLSTFGFYFQHLRRLILKALRYRLPSRYIHRKNLGLDVLKAGYLLLEYIEESDGVMLSRSWEDGQQNTTLRTNLFRSLSRILLTIAKVPVPRIGSFIIDNHGFLELSNRPLSVEIGNLEQAQIPTIPRGVTYSSVDPYIMDTLAFHDSRLRHQPNAALDKIDCVYQMSALATMKSIMPHFFSPEFREGPFVLTLTDLHRSNILVDKDWNITCIIDLEFACSRPIQMLHPPEWLTGHAVDQIDSTAYDTIRQEFMNVFEGEEKQFCFDDSTRLSSIMNQGWQTGTFWFSLALQSPTGLFAIFYDHIQPRFAKGQDRFGNFYKIASQYWTADAEAFIRRKLEEKAAYDEQLKEKFGVGLSE